MHARSLAVLLCLLRVLPAFAGDPPQAESTKTSATLYISEVRRLEELSDARSGKAFALLGRVTIEVPGLFRVRAQRMVLWLHPDADTKVFELVRELRKEDRGIPLWIVRAVYAEGGRVPAVFQNAGRIFRCSSFYYDFTRHRGVFLDAELRLRRSAVRAGLPDLVMRAKRFRETGPGRWRASDVTFFSSNYHEHEVVIEVDRVELWDDAVAKALGSLVRISRRGHRDGRGPTEEEVNAVLAEIEAAAGDPASKHATMEDITAKAYGLPFFGWRRVEIDGEDLLPLRVEVGVGGRGRLGTGAHVGIGMKTKPVAWMFGFGYYEGRGPLIDPELEVNAWGGRLTGITIFAYMHDDGTDDGIVPSTKNRFWIKNQYRFLISEEWRVDIEYADLSDDQWLRTYDEQEFKEGKPQETLAYLRRRGARTYVTLTVKVRTIGFQDEVDPQPRLFGALPVITLLRFGRSGDGTPISLQLAGDFEVANLRHQQGDGAPLPDFRSWRIDARPTLFVSFNLGPVRVVPFGTFQGTAYSEDLSGDAATRYAGSAGVRFDTQLARWFGGVRHVVNFTVEYVDMYSVTVPATDLFPFDARDRLTPFERVSARWRNRLQRRTPAGLVEFLSLELFGAWFPEGEQPLGRMGDGFIEADLRWRVTQTLRMRTEAEVNFETGELATANLEGGWQARPHVWVGASMRHLEGDSDILTASVQFDVDTRWQVITFNQIDFKNNEGLDQGVIIRRLGKTAVFSFRVFFDASEDDLSLSFKIDLLEKFRRKQEKLKDTPREDVGWR